MKPGSPRKKPTIEVKKPSIKEPDTDGGGWNGKDPHDGGGTHGNWPDTGGE